MVGIVGMLGGVAAQKESNISLEVKLRLPVTVKPDWTTSQIPQRTNDESNKLRKVCYRIEIHFE